MGFFCYIYNMFFSPLRQLANTMIDANVHAIINILIKKPEFTKLIIELNTEGQLYEKGVDSLGGSLGNYSANTIEGTAQYAGRAERGLRFDHITLFDTGEFYKSFKVIVRNNSDDFFLIDADPNKDDTDLFREWGEDIVGLTDESIEVLSSRLIGEVQKEVRKLMK